MKDETYDALEAASKALLEDVDALDIETKEGKEALNKAVQLVTLLVQTDKDQNDAWDKQERRRIEEERNEALAEAETLKQKLTPGRAGLEMAKVVVPTVISIIAYNIFQKRVLQFEETGRINSTAGRELHLPKFMK